MISRPLLRRGDRVTVRRDLGPNIDYVMLHARQTTDASIGEMRRLGGKMVQIYEMYLKYHLCESSWNWTDEMFVETARLIQYINEPEIPMNPLERSA